MWTLAPAGGLIAGRNYFFMNATVTKEPGLQAPLFSLGHLRITPGAVDALATTGELPITFLKRHITGDWGDCCPDDAQANDWSLSNGERIFSVYHSAAGDKLWIITEWDRSATTILLPAEY
jgi:hypothetical protein